MADTIVPISLPITFSKVCEVVNQDLSGTSGRHLFGVGGQFAIATGTFDLTYVGAKDRLSNFRGYQASTPVVYQYLLSGTVFSSDVGDGTYNQWIDMPNVKIEDDTFAYSWINSSLGTDYLTTENYGFSIPPSATINGIELYVRRSKLPSSTDIKDGWIYLRYGYPISPNRASTSLFTNSFETVVYGGPTDLWSVGWTPTMINDNTFGAVIRPIPVGLSDSPRAQIAWVKIKVYYTP